MKKFILATAAAGLLVSSQAFAEAPAKPAKIASCVGCHGEGGHSVVPNFPKLAGQHANYTIKQLKDFRDGFRKDATMAAFAKGLTDDEIKAIAEYYAAQK